IKTVAEQASVSEDKAKEALEENSGDLAQAILSLQE
ncbi:nascent polypeptide-associated complex protein, partial [Candidatus Woesearchaeota archaeon]|nr:nascent polypeptide-associated complex protein [Candidatus Woesearchaeota archaeon]MBT7786980.1 nascent polypeptide-associated complex protein [Candidatus Woesearchaeota archaeon]